MIFVKALILFLVAISAWLIGRRTLFSKSISIPMRLRRDYFRGLNYLIHEQPDKAVDVFIKLMEVDSDTVETHLALGGLFRRRGEVDRAIKIHKNLIARPQLTTEYRQQALLELGEDYLSAGVFDRAEEIFINLSQSDKSNDRCLTLLLQIYYREKDWHKAIKTAQHLAAIQGRSYRLPIAHFYCELYEASRDKKQFIEAQLFLKRALSIDRHCVRAYLLAAKVELAEDNYDKAIAFFERAMEEDASYVAELLQPMAACYEAKKAYDSFIHYLESVFSTAPLVEIAVFLAENMRHKHGIQVAIDFLENMAASYPSLETLKPLVRLYAECSPVADRQKLLKLEHHIDLIFSERTKYCCSQCGFSGKTLYWLCPSCQSWSTIKPLHVTRLLSEQAGLL